LIDETEAVRSLPNLSVHQLLYVREAARADTWSDAARRLGVTQPALSQGVAEVERRLGVKLFDRRARQRTATPELAEVLVVAEQILGAVDDLDRRLEELRTGRLGTVRVGMIDTAALGSLAPAVAAFRARRPDVGVNIVVEPSVSLTERLAAGELDLAVVVAPNPVTDRLGRRLESTPLFAEPIYVYPPVALTTGGRTPTHRRPERWGPWVTYPAGSQSRDLIANALVRRGVSMEVVAESSNPDVLRQMVRLGVGWCALPSDVAESGPDPLVRLPGAPLTHRGIVAIRRADALPNASAELLFDDLVNATRS
jgi:DNA-binding transcriptional LysR family regulator